MEKGNKPRTMFSRIIWWPGFFDRGVIEITGSRKIAGVWVKCPFSGCQPAALGGFEEALI